MTKFKDRLVELLQDNNINRTQLSKKIKIAPSILDGYFLNDYYPSIKNAIIISEFFNCSIDYLTGLTDDYSFKKKITGKRFLDNYLFLLQKYNIKNSTLLRDINLDINSLSRWKQGQLPYIQNLILIANYLDTTIEFLLGRTDEF